MQHKKRVVMQQTGKECIDQPVHLDTSSLNLSSPAYRITGDGRLYQ